MGKSSSHCPGRPSSATLDTVGNFVHPFTPPMITFVMLLWCTSSMPSNWCVVGRSSKHLGVSSCYNLCIATLLAGIFARCRVHTDSSERDSH